MAKAAARAKRVPRLIPTACRFTWSAKSLRTTVCLLRELMRQTTVERSEIAGRSAMWKPPKNLARRPDKVLASICSVFLLSSCVNLSVPDPYPAHWTPPQNISKFNGCPKIDGLYLDHGELTIRAWNRDCASGWDGTAYRGECHSLAYNLLYPPHLTGKFDVRIDKPGVTQVELRQPSPELLEVITWPGGENHTLSAVDGAFSCDDSGLRLRDGSSFFAALLWNRFTTETRAFNFTEDGYLIMKVESRSVGNSTFFPIEMNDDGWARWRRIEPQMIDK